MQVRYPEIRRHYLEAAGNAPEVRAALVKAERFYVVDVDMAGRLGMVDWERNAVQDLRRRGMQGILLNKPKGDKRVRMRAHSGVIEAGHVHLPSWATWLGPYMDEMAAFPDGSNDDQVDMTSQALLKLSNSQASVKAAGGQVQSGPTVVRPPLNGRRTRVSIPGLR